MRAFEKEYRSKGKARADYIYGATVGKVRREQRAKRVRAAKAEPRTRFGLFKRHPYKERLQRKRDRLEIAERKERLRVSRLNRRKVR